MHRALLSVVILCLMSGGSSAQLTLQRQFPFVQDRLNTVAAHGDTLFLGGSLDAISQPASHGTWLSAADGSPDLLKDRPVRLPYGSATFVHDVLSDGHGGWYAGGNFRRYGPRATGGLVHIGADGQANDWTAEEGTLDSIRVLAVADNWIFYANDYRVSAVDTATGANIGWSHNVMSVNALAVRDGILYAGGDFSSIGGVQQNDLAAIDIQTGAITPWDPDCQGGFVATLCAHPSGLLVGGNFTYIGEEYRYHLAQVDYTTGLATDLDPDPDYEVTAMQCNSDTLYIAGQFSLLGPTPRRRLAALRISTGATLPWAPHASEIINDLALFEDRVYLTGQFDSLNGVWHDGIGALLTSTGELVPGWTAPSLSTDIENIEDAGLAYAIAADGSSVYVGGNYVGMNSTYCHNFAAVRRSTGEILPWSPAFTAGASGTGGTIHKMVVHDGRLYIAGDFAHIDGSPHNGVACFDLATQTLTSLDPEVGGVENIGIHGGRLYISGEFSQVNGEARKRMASFQLDDYTLTDWNPYSTFVDPRIREMGFFRNRVFVGREAYDPVQAVDTLTGEFLPWISITGGGLPPYVDHIRVVDSTVYMAGYFFEVDDIDRIDYAAAEAMDPVVTDWAPHQWVTNGSLMAANSTTVFIAGPDSLRLVGGGPEWTGVVPVDPTTGEVPLFDLPEFLASYVWVDDSMVVVGTHDVDGQDRLGMAVFSINGPSNPNTVGPSVPYNARLRVWPTPAKPGQLYIEADATFDMASARIELLDASGKMQFFNNTVGVGAGGRARVDLTERDLAPGAYVLRMISGSVVRTAQIVIM